MSDDTCGFLICLLAAILFFCTGASLGGYIETKAIQREAVANGCGEYVTVNDTKVFKWIEKK